MMEETRRTDSEKHAKRRKTNIKKALRKKAISKEVYNHEWYDNLHEYSKNKVHCSCPMCSGMSKTNLKPLRGKGGALRQEGGTTNHRKGKNWRMGDMKKLERMDYDEQDG